MITKKSIMEAWTFLREKNYTIPDETLDFMRDVSLKALEQERLSNVPKANACPQLYEGWRDARKELPSSDYGVYFVYDKEKSMGFAHYLGDGIFGGWPDVIAWMPLPSPPAFV